MGFSEPPNSKSVSTVSNTSEPKTEKSEPTNPVVPRPYQPSNQVQNLIVGESQSEKGKIIFWIGVSLLLLVVLFAFFTFGIPQIFGQVHHCAPFSEGPDGCGTLGLALFGIAGLIFFGTPITLVGITMTIHGYLKRRGKEHPLRTALLYLTVPIVVVLYIITLVMTFLF